MTDRRAGDRRTSRVALRLPDRRTGFDRRQPNGVVAWYRDHPPLIAAALVAVLLLNLSDWLLTLRALERGAREVNPVMASLLEHSRALAGATKLGLALAVVAVIWQLRRYRRILQVSLVALAGFSALLVYQLTLVASGL
jgi:hypothetical protein